MGQRAPLGVLSASVIGNVGIQLHLRRPVFVVQVDIQRAVVQIVFNTQEALKLIKAFLCRQVHAQ